MMHNFSLQIFKIEQSLVTENSSFKKLCFEDCNFSIHFMLGDSNPIDMYTKSVSFFPLGTFRSMIFHLFFFVAYRFFSTTQGNMTRIRDKEKSPGGNWDVDLYLGRVSYLTTSRKSTELKYLT